MSRRKTVALVSAAALLVLSGAAVGVAVSLTQTGTGQEWVRRTLVDQLAPRVKGRLHVGRISGGLLRGVTIDSLEIRGPDDSLFVATGRIRVTYDVRDLVDKRVLLRHVEVRRPVVRLAQEEGGTWNYRRVFPKGPPRTGPRERGFGDFVVADSVTVRDGRLVLTMPWHPADSLRGARRDSAVAFNLRRPDAEIRRAGGGRFARTWRWRGDVASDYVRLADPDSVGRYYGLADVDVDETDPPFRFRDVRGGVRHLGDSVWLDVARFDLPGSTGRARGKVVWGSGLPVRYDVRVVADSVSLADVGWVYPTLPRSGGGRMDLHVRNDPRDLRVIDYALSRMDVRTTGSRLLGRMTYGVGGPVLVLKDVDLRAAPVDFALLRALNGKPFPYDWRGALTGTVRARGGPLHRFQLDEARLAFADANVAGAVSRATARGGLDVLFPAFTRFRGLALDVQRLDLRTIQYVNPEFPPLGGTVAGRVTLDSSWLDVRFRDADLTHAVAGAPPSRFTGRGRVTLAEPFLVYDLDVQAAPLSLTALATAYPAMPLRGLVAGPIRAGGTLDDLRVVASLAGDAGTVAFDGTVDAFEPAYAARGTSTFAGLDLRALLGDPRLPATQLAGRAEVDAAGSALSDVRGTVALALDRSLADGVRLYGGTARARFGGGHLQLDTLGVESAAGRLDAAGALGLDPDHVDTLRFAVTVDSLGGLRRWLGTRAIALDSAARVDSLAGSLTLAGAVAGTIDTTRGSAGLSVAARVRGDGLVWGGARAQALTGTLRFGDLLRAPTGAADAVAESLLVAGVRVPQAAAVFALDGAPAGAAPAGRFALRAGSDSAGPALALNGRTGAAGDTTLVHLDSGALLVAPGRRYALAGPARVALHAPTGLTGVDSIVLADGAGARLAVAGTLRGAGPIAGTVAAERVPLADAARLTGAPLQADGRLDLALRLGGTREAPLVDGRADAADLRVGGAALGRVTAVATYADRRAVADVTLVRGGARLLEARAELPVDLSPAAVPPRALREPLRGTLRADSLDLALLAALTPGVEDARGRLRADLDLGGTWARPVVRGAVTVDGGAATVRAAGIRVTGVGADVMLAGDSVHVRRLSARSGGPADTASLTGSVVFRPFENPRFALRLAARNFLAVDRARLATLWLSTPRPLTLDGPYLGATLRGAVRAERGRISIPELIDKRIVDLNEYRDVVDTTVFRNRALLPGAPSAFVENLTVDDLSVGVGQDVWLRSPEANIKLGGRLDVTGAVGRGRGGARESQLALLGTLDVERGTYRLNLGIAQPSFDVQPGSLRFFGTPDLNPTLDIRAVHTVRQARAATNNPDVRVQVNIGGTLNQPTLRLSSADNPPIADTDLISYLVTGEPAAAVLGQGQGSGDQGAAVTSIVSRLAGSVLSGALSGGPFDIVQVQTGGIGDERGDIGQSSREILGRTRLGVGGRLDDKTFYTLSTGLCGLTASSQNAFNLFANGLGVRVERRITSTFNVELSVEPASSAQTCGQASTSRVFQNTPRQFGLDFSRLWQW